MTSALSAAGVASAAAGGDVIFNEVMYHAPDGTTDEDDDYDYVELYNNGDAPVDLLGWTFTEGFDFEFVAPFVLGSGEYAIVAHDAAAFQERYGFAPAAEFADGKLKNSSEEIELTDDLGNVVDFLEYNDDPPWPGGADGEGRSLERLDPDRSNAGDDSDATNWLASGSIHGTPGAVNSILTSSPVFAGVDDGSERPAPGAGIRVSASVLNVDDVTISYRVGFTDSVEMPMLDDAASAGGAGDGVFSAVLPAQEPRALVRYVITAHNDNGTTTSPAESDTVASHGVVVADPDAPSDAPVLDWFIADVDYNHLLGRNRFTDKRSPIVVAYGDTVIDNATIRVRGNVTRSLPKPSMRIELPKGKVISFGDNVDAPVDEFNLFYRNDVKTDIGWEIAEEIGLLSVDYFGMRVYRNGDYWGTGAYLTALDSRWRESVGYDDAASYKARMLMAKTGRPRQVERQWEKKAGSGDFTDIWELTNTVLAVESDRQLRDLMEGLDVPTVVNYWAYVSFLNQHDAVIKNHYLIRDPEGSGRWHVDLWDLNLSVGKGNIFGNDMPLVETLNRYPEFREMHARRLKSMIDSYTATELVDRYEQRFAQVEQSLIDDRALWQQGVNHEATRRTWVNGLPRRYEYFDEFTELATGRGLPGSQTTDRPIRISAVTAQVGPVPATVELTNTSSSESFDLTGWALDTIDAELPAGTVLLPGATVVLTTDDVALREMTDGLFAAGEFSELPDDGVITLRDAHGQEVHSRPFGSGDHDGDGVVNSQDNCPSDANADQADTDLDGVGDVCDPETAIPGSTVTVDGTNTAPTVTIDARNEALGVSWLPVAGAQKYRYRVGVSGGAYSEWTQVGSATTVLIDGLVNGVDYTVAVSARVARKWKPSTEATLAPLPIDTDGDGVPDDSDNCPADANGDQADGDGDGVGDSCDPDLGDGPTGDPDGDGVPNDSDNCPADANGDQADGDGDGVGDACDPDPDGEVVVADGGPDSPTVRVVIGEGTLRATWDPVPGATEYLFKYRLWREPWIKDPASNTRQRTLTDLNSAISYTISVRAKIGGRWKATTTVVVSPG